MTRQRMLEEIEEFLCDKVEHHGCSLCGGKEWLIDYADAILMVKRGAASTSFGVPFIITECNNCGNMRSHSLRAFEKWKDDRRWK